MNNHRKSGSSFWIKPSVVAVAAALSLSSFAAEQDDEKKADKKDDVKVVIVGSRAAPRSVTESAVPVDIISGEEFESQGITDMNSMLAVSVPSFNVNAQPISDAATLVRPANLRGLPPDSTLILLNGKRRHRSAVITFLGGGLSDGSQGPDISVIPSIALKQIEVLRDGAAAQYGSDAIAGVMNFVLKDSASGGYVELSNGQFYEGDGNTTKLAANIGTEMTERGFANFSFEYKQADPTSRSVQREDAQDLADLRANGNDDIIGEIANPAQIWGSPEIKSDWKLFANLGIDLSNRSQWYLFGNLAEREIEGGFYYRNPFTRSGVNADGDGNHLVIDLTPNDGLACPTFPAGDLTGLRDVFADPNCFAFNELLPGGFTPRFGGTVSDQAFVTGYSNEFDSGLTYDVSVSYGKNEVDFNIKNTINPSLGPDTPFEFNPGSYTQEEKGANFDISYPVGPVNIAAGAEYRDEAFGIKAGDEASYTVGPYAADGFGIGSNGFPGFQPRDAGEWSRSNWAAYLDAEIDVTESFFLSLATRFEDYSDFGFTENSKIAGRLQWNDEIAFRGAVSTGFRAPTVGQSNVRNVTTAFGDNGLEDQATLPPTNPIAVQKGGQPLEPEQSKNFSIGSVMEFDNLFITVDYYRIKVEDRISLTSPQALTPQDITELVNQGVTDATSYTSVRFFTNDFDSRTQGVDLVANYSTNWFGGNTDLGLVYNWTDTQVDVGSSNTISATRARLLEENLPDIRATLSLNQKWNDWRATVRYNHYSGYFEDHLDSEAFPIEEDRSFTLDVELGYDVNQNFNLVFGVQNITDETPSENPWAGIAGAKYAVTSPFGFNGGYYYVRLGYDF
ncbi:MAG: TonB-dependent receptor [Gammaproteobacteria bacterium]|nr:TonB-dependent receptor [Gammaproteobacteria bacterium]